MSHETTLGVIPRAQCAVTVAEIAKKARSSKITLNATSYTVTRG